MNPMCYRMFEYTTYPYHMSHLIKLCEECDFDLYLESIGNYTTIDISIYNKNIFNHCCKYNLHEACVWLMKTFKIDVRNFNDNALLHSCENGNNNLCKIIISQDKTVIGTYNYIQAFTYACIYNHMELSKWLYDYYKIANKDIDVIFRKCCEKGLVEMCGWLLEINPYMSVIKDDDMYIHEIIHDIIEDKKIFDEWVTDIHA